MRHKTTLYGTRRPSSTPFAKRHSRNASNNGGTAGRRVFSHSETTSKGIRVSDLQACKCIFPAKGRILFEQASYIANIHNKRQEPTDINFIRVFFYLPTDAQQSCFKKNIKIYIKTAPTCRIILNICVHTTELTTPMYLIDYFNNSNFSKLE